MYDSIVCLSEDGIWGQLGSGVKVGMFRLLSWVILINFGSPLCFW